MRLASCVLASLLLAAHPASAALVNIGTNNGKTVTDISITVPGGGVPAGALIIVCSSARSGSGPASATTDSKSNTYTDVGKLSNTVGETLDIQYAWNAIALVSGDTITVHYTSITYAITAFYWDGAQTSSDPRDTTAGASTTGSSQTPSLQMGAAPAVANSLAVGVIALAPDVTFTNTWATTLPTMSETTGGGTATNAQVAGGSEITSTRDTYAPTLGASATWTEMIVVFKPLVAASCRSRMLIGVGC